LENLCRDRVLGSAICGYSDVGCSAAMTLTKNGVFGKFEEDLG